MKKLILAFIAVSYIVPSVFKLVAYIREGRDIYWLALPILSSTIFAVVGYYTFKGNLVSKYLMCIFLIICGLYMIPCYFAPAIKALSMRLFLGSYGVMWLVSSIWVFRAYPKEQKGAD